MSLTLVADYWIDLGFDLAAATNGNHAAMARRSGERVDRPPIALSDVDRRVIAAMEPGLPLVSAPYVTVGEHAGVSETEVLTRISRWLDAGVIKRLGIIVRHRELGYAANAMCVWDVPDADVDRMGKTLARETGVTLCYRRERWLPDWPYNLYCMVHGRDRAQVELQVADMAAWHGLDRFRSAMLFSRRRFKQRGARYCTAAPGIHRCA
jgi:siroheme decarboxylase